MKSVIVVYGYPCSLSIFVVNGVKAVSEDFGTQGDDPTQAVLDKYKITTEEYYEIAEILEAKLSFGSCGWCS